MQISVKVTDDGGLKIDAGEHGVDISSGYDPEVLNIAFDQLVGMAAGFNKYDLTIAVGKALLPAA